jgi:hypothetical protein
MTPTGFKELPNMVSPFISRKNTSFRQAIPSSDQLAVMLRLARQFDVFFQNIQGIHFLE